MSFITLGFDHYPSRFGHFQIIIIEIKIFYLFNTAMLGFIYDKLEGSTALRWWTKAFDITLSLGLSYTFCVFGLNVARRFFVVVNDTLYYGAILSAAARAIVVAKGV